jgi:hypothetical protein
LQRCGQADKARETFQEILTRARRSPGYYRRAQRQWISIAKKQLVQDARSSTGLK